jgi:hypothetical protein
MASIDRSPECERWPAAEMVSGTHDLPGDVGILTTRCTPSDGMSGISSMTQGHEFWNCLLGRGSARRKLAGRNRIDDSRSSKI